MKQTVFLCAGGDARQTYMSQALSVAGKVYTYMINSSSDETTALSHLDEMYDKADILVLPIMSGNGLEVGTYGGKKLYVTELSSHLKNGALVTGGRMNTSQIEYFSALGFDTCDYFRREELVIKNCIPTAEGVLEIAMQELATTINGTSVLVLGYGRTAKACADIFKAVGADVTVCARKLSQIAEADNNKLKTMHLNMLRDKIENFELIINTVPSMILTEKILSAVSKNALIIDIASADGGTDFEAAKRLNRKTIHALSLPGRMSPVTSGKIIAETVLNIYGERSRKDVFEWT